MSFNRTSSRVAIGLWMILLASPALSQGPQGMQLFAPADVSTFGTPHLQPNEGYFFSFDGMYMSVQAPKERLIGATGFRDVGTNTVQVIDITGDEIPVAHMFSQTSTEDTSELKNNFEAGQRWEFGRVEDRQGWLVSIFRWGPNQQQYTSTGANVLFDDPLNPDTDPPQGLLYGQVGVGPWVVGGEEIAIIRVDENLPVVFDSINVYNKIDVWGVEASYLRRAMTFHNGGNAEVYLGARYLEFNELFGVSGAGGVLDLNTHWSTSANNHIVGPQVGGRYFKTQGRWTFSTEGRFMAGLNRQNIFQEGSFGYVGLPGTNLKPNAWLGSQYSHRTTLDEFSPLLELRFDLRYTITRAIDFRVGWTGFWVDGIARPNGLINYAVPTMGIDTTNNRQGVFVNGVTIGFDINR